MHSELSFVQGHPASLQNSAVHEQNGHRKGLEMKVFWVIVIVLLMLMAVPDFVSEALSALASGLTELSRTIQR